MNTQTESKRMIETSKPAIEIENPMQDHSSVTVDERDVLAAAVFAARRLEVRQEAGHTSTILFVP